MSLLIEIETYGEIQHYLPQPLHYQFDQQQIKVAQIFTVMAQQFPHAEQALERCACAVGDAMLGRHSILSTPATLVLLSPVAGG